MVDIEINDEFQRALDLMDSGRSAFITGKAGTGKSTLLGLWRDQQESEPMVVAPTGVAALNVGGTTIHRLFNFSPSISPEMVNDGHWYPRDGGQMLSQLRTLVIDEVSMCRADLLDAADAALRKFGPTPGKPFGGVQLIMFGDPYQLSPVVQKEEEDYFTRHYTTPFFFGSRALSELDFAVVELQRVYRQQDEKFVGLLNRVREGTVTVADLDVLESRVDPEFEPPTTGDVLYVTLTTTNRNADRVNQRHLDQLWTAPHYFSAQVSGDVRRGDQPTEVELELKVDAQVMLLNNDPADRWVNGSVAVVTSMGEDSVVVRLRDSNEEVVVAPHTWEILRPTATGGRIHSQLVGTFTQLPLRLGWAVTIHKSQGKTLPRTIIDLGRGAFADGQTYVALSRCTSLEGLKIRRPVRRRDIRVSSDVRRFLRRHSAATTAETVPNRGWAVVSAITTGYNDYDRVLEIACDLWDSDGAHQSFHTLINPTRDVGDPNVHGIRAGDVTHAPTFAEAWPFIARRLHGYVLVIHGLYPLTRVLDTEGTYAPEVSVDWGAGVCTHQQLGGELAGSVQSAGAQVAATTELLYQVGVGSLSILPVQVGEVATVGRLLPRDGSVIAPPAVNPGLSDAANYSDMLAAAMTDPLVTVAKVASLSEQFGLDADRIRDVHAQYAELTATAVRRDRHVSQADLDHIITVFAALGFSVPEDLGNATELELVEPQVGWKTCFTGTAIDADGRMYEREELMEWAVDLGLKTMRSVTKNTDLLVVADRASMSGKAKKAHQYGIAIMTIPEWLQWARN